MWQNYFVDLHIDHDFLCNWPNTSKPHYGPGVDSASNRNEYQEESSLGIKLGRPALKADNLTAICEPIV
jgi:hypothetical protein